MLCRGATVPKQVGNHFNQNSKFVAIGYCEWLLAYSRNFINSKIQLWSFVIKYLYLALSVGLSVCLSVCYTVTLVIPAKTAEPIETPFGLRTLVGPGNHVLDGSRSLMGRGNFEGRKGCPIVKNRCILRSSVQNGWTDRDAVWVFGSDEPKEWCVRWGSRSPMRWGSFGGKERSIVNHSDFPPWAVQK